MYTLCGKDKAKFTLDVTRPEKHEPDLMVVQGRGKAPGSSVDLSGRMNLSAVDPEHTRMDWTSQVNVSGTLASVGARLLQIPRRSSASNFSIVSRRSCKLLKP